MATADKTTFWAFATQLADVATNTTLGTATRNDFAAITISIPETTRTIKSAILRVTARDHFATALSITGWRLGIKLGAVAFDDVDYASTIAHTSSHEGLIVQRDVTSYFVTNFGAGTSQTCQVGFACSTSAASVVDNITAELEITYDYDNTSATQAKTIEFVLQGEQGTIGTSYVEVGTTSQSAAPVNQIPNLTGAGGLLPEAGIAIQQCYLRVSAMDAGLTANTDFNATYKIDSGGADSVRATLGQGTNANSAQYRDIFDLLAYGMSTTAAHAFFAKSSLATTFEGIGAVLVVTYTFTGSGTTRELHSCRLPLENPRVNGTPNGPSNVAGDGEWLSATLNIQELGTITLVQSGFATIGNFVNATVQTNLLAQGQTARPYFQNSLVTAGFHICLRRADHDSSSWALARGKNTLNIEYFGSGVSINQLGGYAIVNYTADVPATGIGSGNRSTSYPITSHQTEAIATVLSAPERVPAPPDSPFVISGAYVEYGVRFGSATYLSIEAERQAGEDSGKGWYSGGSRNDLVKLGRREFIIPITQWVRGASYQTSGMDLKVSRRWRISAGFVSMAATALARLTHHGVSYTLQGSVTVNGVGVPDGKPVVIFAIVDSANVEIVTTVTTFHSIFTATVPDNTRTYFASYIDGSNVGRSANSTPSGIINVDIFTAVPDITITSTPTVISQSTSATFTYSVTVGSAEYSLDGAAYVPTFGPISLTNLAQGVHTLTIRSTTSNAKSETFTWTVNTGLGAPSFPALTNATTADAIRDRAIVCVEAIIPTYLSHDRFRRYFNEGESDFMKFAEAKPQGALRRFQIRFDGTERTPAVSNSDFEERLVTLTTIIAYPHNARTGSKQALDRDTAMDRDYDLIEKAIGLYSRANFSAPFPDACWASGDCQRAQGSACDFLVFTSAYTFRRVLT